MQRGLAITLGFIAALVSGAALGGCTTDGEDGGILVLKNVAADSMCVANASATELAIPHGSLDLFLPGGYLFIAQLKSRITALVGQEDQRTIIIQGANIDITFPGSTLFSAAELADFQTMHLTQFRQLFSNALTPNGGIADAGFILIPGELTAAIRAKVDLTKRVRVEALATFTIDGVMSGGVVTSQPFSYPITIGNGVAVNILGNCPLPMGTPNPRTGYACNPAQDGVVDCCLTGPISTTAPTCPATVSTM
jgi:hypothetical protein